MKFQDFGLQVTNLEVSYHQIRTGLLFEYYLDTDTQYQRYTGEGVPVGILKGGMLADTFRSKKIIITIFFKLSLSVYFKKNLFIQKLLFTDTSQAHF